MRKILPLLLALLGLAAGGGAGFALRPAPSSDAPPPEAKAETQAPPDYVKLNNQFVVPVVEDGRVAALVILALSLEVTQGNSEAVYLREPKLRDGMLQVLFDHANAGGFRGAFTDGSNLVLLRKALLETAKQVLGDMVSDVLIVDIMRQDS
ncbi:flagellar basal body-associated FliL family protein [Fertoebacter nigrum]|uniref:Flagellar basal body-associated FliL family protein n=1 Tax=Fertoeibacter niger TaxID=2656921 RepID=A0A8X8H1N6_9RHOB|nr:flagellar basal body-associated FliL family protein [Fertoeibacter niger]NUB44609.1 flagellar basal body-associated FliL family protein [Fertoeibacter niger]